MRSYLKPYTVTLAVIGCALFIACLAFLSPVTQEDSDPHFSLIVSQSILENGTIKLDAYHEKESYLFDAFFWQVGNRNGHFYYNYPPGPSLFSLPAVGVAMIMGRDMLHIGQNHWLQNLLSAALTSLVFVVIYLIGRCYLTPGASLVVAIISVLGSALISTMGTALWNMDFAVLFITLGMLLICRFDSGRSSTVHPYWLGCTLFAAYLSRPSASIFILIVLLYLLLKNRRALYKTAITSLALLVLFLLASQLEYGQPLSFYYSASNWFNTSRIARPIYGLLLSPARGLFTYSPFLVLPLVGGIIYFKYARASLLFWLSALWLTVQVIAVSTTRQWWGGFSYGPRLLTDAMPALILMSIILWYLLAPRLSSWESRIAVSAYLILGIWALFVNSYQGLFNVKTAFWNDFPNIEVNQEDLFDWKYPQFLTGVESFHERRLEHYQKELANNSVELDPYVIGDTLTPASDMVNAIFVGWKPFETGIQWTETSVPRIFFTLDSFDLAGDYVLDIGAGSDRMQEARVLLNENELGSVTFRGARATHKLEFEGDLLRTDEVNELSFQFLEAPRRYVLELRQFGPRLVPQPRGLSDVEVRISKKE